MDEELKKLIASNKIEDSLANGPKLIQDYPNQDPMIDNLILKIKNLKPIEVPIWIKWW